MPITANLNRHPDSDRRSETAPPYPEEMNATVDFSTGNAVSFRATVRTTPASLVATALLTAVVLFPLVSLAKRLLDERRSGI
jgi:hypothetical protein